MSTSPLEKVYTESSNNYRFFVDLRYKVVQLFAFAQFGISTAIWGSRGDIPYPVFAVVGIIACVICGFIDYRLSNLVYQYSSKCRECRDKLIDDKASPSEIKGEDNAMTAYQVFMGVFFIALCILWACFAILVETPTRPKP